MNNISKKMLTFALCAVVLFSSPSWASTVIKMGDFSWDSVQLHNRIAGYVLEHGLGFEVQYEFAESLPLLMGMARGDVDASTEIWSDNLKDAWTKMIDEGTAVDLGPTYPDANQGWYVPAYVIKGDPERGIEPMAPDLKSVYDLVKYKDLFAPKSGGEKGKGRFYNGPTGWVTYTINEVKLKAYGLDEHYENFSSGSSTALATAIFSAYRKGEPVLAYYWEPTPLMGMLDMIQLEEPPYEHKKWDEKTYDGAFPPSRVHVGIGTHLFKKAPQAVTILANYSSTLEQTNAALAYMESNKATLDETVVWFLREYPDQWRRWFPIANDPRIEKVEEALSKER
ncbi:ABC transporter substrate-binding protein [Dethiosulfovibrio salsuginis]|uniref:Glycine betaine/proline transport system substrate-binding protein n=1 Tax=Dethiosulfovibrio salsuginis TaxID=561720 RepID=A0A1X7KX50_9BACT|nr:ABC transporter substrate-binding protein [Dethiosulfovibrio salsuginis]SMG46010.1 glycine betaine/proline transport system substrate-binding protein [Dethiosulfovibrio salsuginis]